MPPFNPVQPYGGVPFVDPKLTDDQKKRVNYFREKRDYGYCAEHAAFEYMRRRYLPNRYMRNADEIQAAGPEWTALAQLKKRQPDENSPKQLHECTVRFLREVYGAEVDLRHVGGGWYVTTSFADEARAWNRFLNIQNAFGKRVACGQGNVAVQAALRPKTVDEKFIHDEVNDSILDLQDAHNDIQEHYRERKELLNAKLEQRDQRNGLVSVPIGITSAQAAAQHRKRVRDAKVKLMGGPNGKKTP